MDRMDDVGRKAEKAHLKKTIQSLFRQWHPDVVGGSHGSNFSVAQILAELNTSLNEDRIINFSDGWPDTVLSGTKVDFPSGASVFLPETPEKFFELLTRYKDNIELNQDDYPQSQLKYVRRGKSEEESERKFDQDPTLDKFWNFVVSRESIDELIASFDLFSLYSEDQLREINIPDAADKRAAFLFGRAAWNHTSKSDIDAVIEQVRSFPYFNETNRSHTLANIALRAEEIGAQNATRTTRKSIEEIHARKDVERESRQAFIARIRSSSTAEELKSLDEEVQKFDFFNRGELGVVRSAISRKKRKLGAE